MSHAFSIIPITRTRRILSTSTTTHGRKKQQKQQKQQERSNVVVLNQGASAEADINAVFSSTLQPMGDADRAFRLGVELEKSGQARAAAAAFHESATLYQCFLDEFEDEIFTTTTPPTTSSTAKEEQSSYSSSSSSYDNTAFGHVTGLSPNATSPNSCHSVLAYACLRLAHLSDDALGDAKAALRLYRNAISIDPIPSCFSYDGAGTTTESSFGKLQDAVLLYRKAAQLAPGNGKILFHLAVALERTGSVEEANSILEQLRRSESSRACLVDSWGYVRWHTRKTKPAELNLHRGTRAMLQIGINAAMPLILQQQHKQQQQQQNNNNNGGGSNDNGSSGSGGGGLVCEFGVGSGRSTRMIQEMLPLDVPIHGFDTFTGLPYAWGNEPVGAYSTGGSIPNMDGAIYFHKGLFRDTLPRFLNSLENDNNNNNNNNNNNDNDVEESRRQQFRPLAFANIDCDLYSSTLDVLEAMHGRIVPGTILVFDEYLGYSTWRQDEFRAWRESCKRFGWQYEYLAFSLSTKQAVVRVI